MHEACMKAGMKKDAAVAAVAESLHVASVTIYRWRAFYKNNGLFADDVRGKHTETA